MKNLAKLIEKNNPVIFDIGCYDGKDSLEFLQLYKNAKIFAFDPLPNLTDNFKNCIKNNKIKLVKTALGNVDSDVEWFISNNHPASNSMKAPKDTLTVFKEIKFSKYKDVNCERLDTWVEKNFDGKTIDLLWVDVNGAEKEFLEGATQTIFEKVQFIFIEFTKVGGQQLYEGSLSKQEILKKLKNFEELGTYSFMGNFGNLLLKRKIDE